MQADRLNELAQTRSDYWRELVKLMRRSSSAITFGEASLGHQLRAKADALDSGKFVLVALANVRPESRIGVGVEILGSEGYYAALERDISSIQRDIGCERGAGERFEWNPKTHVRDVWLYRRVDIFERQRWQEQHEWLREKLEAFRAVLQPKIAELLATGLKSKRAI
jgi:hypothetical protein